MARFASRFAPAQAINEARYLIVPCDAPGSRDLAVIWDRLDEQVVDVIDASAGRWSCEDELWDEVRADHGLAHDAEFRMAA